MKAYSFINSENTKNTNMYLILIKNIFYFNRTIYSIEGFILDFSTAHIKKQYFKYMKPFSL